MAAEASRTGARGLFVGFEGLPDTIVESQVLVHLADMRREGLEIDFLSFAVSRGILEAARLARPGLEPYGVRVDLRRAVRPAMPASERVNAGRLRREMQARPRYAFLHARTDYAAAVCALVPRKERPPLLWDCRGDSAAEYELGRASGVLRGRAFAAWQRRKLRRRIEIAARGCDRALFVSEALRDRVLPAGFDRPVHVVPSAASEQRFRFDPRLRAEARGALGVAGDRVVLVYAGSAAPYQSFPEVAAVFRRLAAQDDRVFLLVLSPAVDRAAELLATCPTPSWRVLKAPFTEVNRYLNAADFALFPRRADAVNRVASPVKFAEYALAGLPVVMTGAVEQSAALAREIGNAVFYELGSTPRLGAPRTERERATIAERAAARLSRGAVRGEYLRIYGALRGTGAGR